MAEKTDVLGYWNRYYSSKESSKILPPSQFASFLIGEIPESSVLVDIGCGSGRDAFFFAQYGHDVIGIDGSISAIENCKERAEKEKLNAWFLQGNICDSALTSRMLEIAPFTRAKHLTFYARFFLHAITNEAEDQLISFFQQLGKKDSILALEFRTHKDATLPKSTETHFRRFVDPVELFQKIGKLGLHVAYFVEGFGFAKRGLDDAHIARFIIRK
ncbi:MAG: class I SAM-dependent methyltransferase [Acidobacteria bacterium]|nr:class I SAM-dependent methyltransferase [Acidobacteriota bacterium]MCB9397018.1 class I SAM-dependent methyltransferase [Acidobacteriota bacterium]